MARLLNAELRCCVYSIRTRWSSAWVPALYISLYQLMVGVLSISQLYKLQYNRINDYALLPGSVAFHGVAVLFPLPVRTSLPAVLFPLPVRTSLPAVVSFSLRLPGLLAQSLLVVKWLLVTASWTTRLGLWLGVPGV